jgi:hypothetical protein
MLKIRHGIAVLVAVVSTIALLGACAETKQVSLNEPVAQGFLPNPSLLQKGTAGEADQVYLNPGANWPSYTKMILDPVTIWEEQGSTMGGASPKEQTALADALYSDLYNAASKRCQMVGEAAPGTLRVKVALVDAQSANPALNTISTYVPQIKLLDTVAGYAFNSGVAYWVGQATAQAYAKDATTGELLWEAEDRRAGTKAFRRDTFNSWGMWTMRSRRGLLSSPSGSASWGRVRRRRRPDNRAGGGSRCGRSARWWPA